MFEKLNINHLKNIAEITSQKKKLQDDLLDFSNRISIMTKENSETCQQLKSQKKTVDKENINLKNEITILKKANAEVWAELERQKFNFQAEIEYARNIEKTNADQIKTIERITALKDKFVNNFNLKHQELHELKFQKTSMIKSLLNY